MASTLFRTVSTVSRKACRFQQLMNQVRHSGGQANVGVGIEPHKEKLAMDTLVPSGGGHRVGPEKWEIAALEQQIMDPWGTETRVMAEGTYDRPNIVPSMESRRIIGCICDPDSEAIIWTWLERGEPRRCMCGHWFKLVDMGEEDVPQ